MKRLTLFLWLNLYPAIILMAQRDYSKYGRDYIEREDSPFISPVELIGGAALIVGGYWGLRGILSLIDSIGTRLKEEPQSRNNITNVQKNQPNSVTKKVEVTKSLWDEVHELEKEYETYPSSELAERISERYQTLKDTSKSELWKIFALLRKPRLKEEEIWEFYRCCANREDYYRLNYLFSTYNGRWSHDQERAILSFFRYRIPYSKDWKTPSSYRERADWIVDETKMSWRFELLCTLVVSDSISDKLRERIMVMIAQCYALGYGTKKDLTEALCWADLIEEYKLKNIK